MKALHGRVLRNNVFNWGDRFLASMQDAVSARRRHSDTPLKQLLPAEIREAYMRGSRRLLILDYDGTLVPLVGQPRDAVPPAAVIVSYVPLPGTRTIAWL